MFIKKVRKTLKKYNMLSAKERVLVGVSGGPDSVALLHALYRLKEDFGIEIFIGHLNHMFRPKDSNKAENFVKNLELDETLGQLLVAEGFSSIDDIKDTTIESLIKIEGIEEDTAKALIERAKEFHQKDQEDISERIKELGLQDALINLKGLTPGMLMTLGDQKILTLEDFADLASDELTGGFDIVKGERVKIQGYLEDFALSKEEADELVMSARNIVYKD